MQNDPALEAFDRLRVREVRAEFGDTVFAFLPNFQSTAASLEPDERIKIDVNYLCKNMESLKAVLADPQASKICALRWEYNGEENVNSIIPLLISNCPELASLDVYFNHHSAFDFASSLLEHPCTKIKVLEMLGSTEGDLARFFAALGRSQVSALALYDSSEVAQGLHEYLARDLLVRLNVRVGNEQILLEMMTLLANCTRLAKLEMSQYKLSQSTAFNYFPKSVTKLGLDNCAFVGGFDWSFLADSNVRELDLFWVSVVNGNQLGGALAVHLRAKGLDELRFYDCDFVDETLAVVGVEVGRIKRLEIYSNLSDASIKLIATALKSPNNEMKELKVEYDRDAASIETLLMPALNHPNCNLAKLRLWALSEHEKAAKRVEDMFCNRLTLFVLLQGKQVKKRYCPLRRLPVEMFRLVGAALI
ncbi:hypothetical protein BASA81_001849 [Batrachochytrium salamandrivorans]|nr:hypothetical protein BASA81_001849 [Batrachochytrium salamandrivorans]